MAGKLYLCATPIGNLEDITYRVVRTLKEVDIIGAEDTRNSIKLLNHFDIKTPMTSYHEFNKYDKAKVLRACGGASQGAGSGKVSSDRLGLGCPVRFGKSAAAAEKSAIVRVLRGEKLARSHFFLHRGPFRALWTRTIALFSARDAKNLFWKVSEPGNWLEIR